MIEKNHQSLWREGLPVKIVLTGASGFLGRSILSQVQYDSDLQVIAVTSRPHSIKETHSIKPVSNEQYLSGTSLAFGADVLLNCAFPRNEEPLCMSSGLDYLNDVAKTIQPYNFSSVVNISSQSVYSQFRSAPATEEAQICLESKYAVAKYAMEMLFDSYCLDIPHTHIRLASLIGPGFEQRLPNKLARNAIRSRSLKIEERGQLYGYMHVHDAAAGILHLLNFPASNWRNVYNLGTNEAISIMEMADVVIQCMSEKGLSVAETIVDLRTEGACFNSTLDAGLFQRSFSWAPCYSAKQAIRDIVLSELDSIEGEQ